MKNNKDYFLRITTILFILTYSIRVMASNDVWNRFGFLVLFDMPIYLFVCIFLAICLFRKSRWVLGLLLIVSFIAAPFFLPEYYSEFRFNMIVPRIEEISP